MYSFYFRSRRDITLSGGAASTSDDLRSDCPADATDPPFDMVAAANTPDSAGTAAGEAGPGASGAKPAKGKRKSCAKLKRRVKRSKRGAKRKKLKRKLRRCRARR
jgi:hypothetical protein